MEIHATEFTPRDLYELNFFDRTFVSKDANCRRHDAGHPYCQFLGKYQMEFPNYSTVAPYPNMNERCPMISPIYKRTDKC